MANSVSSATATSSKDVIIITGSTGRIGSRILSQLSERYHIVALYFPEFPAPEDEALADYKCVDLTRDDQVERAFQEILETYGNRIASIVHLAAFYSFKDVGFEPYEKVNIGATRRLLRAAQAFHVQQFVFTSTMLVHKPGQEAINEDSPLGPQWDYPKSKALSERVIREEHGEIPFVILRLAGCYDETGNCPPLIEHMGRIKAMKLESLFFPGNRTHEVPYLHIEDTIRLVEATVEKRKELPSELTLLAAEPRGISYGELQKTLGRLIHGVAWPMIWVPKWVSKVGLATLNYFGFMRDNFIQPWMIDLADVNYQISSDRARRTLDWEPEHSIRETLPEMTSHLPPQ